MQIYFALRTSHRRKGQLGQLRAFSSPDPPLAQGRGKSDVATQPPEQDSRTSKAILCHARARHCSLRVACYTLP